MTRHLLKSTALALALIAATPALAQDAEVSSPEKWNLMLITDGNRAGAGVSAIMDSKEACLTAASTLTSTAWSTVHSRRVAYCVSSKTGDVVEVAQE